MVYHHNASEWDCHHCARRRPKEPSTDVDMLPNPPKLIIEGIVTIEVPQDGVQHKARPTHETTQRKRSVWLTRHMASEHDVQTALSGRDFIEVNGIREYLPPMLSA